jgi:prepilin-type N-terminal cleavage/methylation domain-containing protein
MKKKKGFTLIELLVVVLIIGILAAIALPQYQLAVLKTKLSTLFANTKALAQAEEEYYLVNSEYTDNFDNLIISLKNVRSVSGNTAYLKDGSSYRLLIAGRHSGKRVIGVLSNNGPAIHFILKHSDAPDSIECYTPKGDAPAKDTIYDKACMALGGVYYEFGVDGTARVYKIK